MKISKVLFNVLLTPFFTLIFNKGKKIVKAAFVIILFLPLVCFSVEQKLDKETTVFDQTFSWQAMLGFSIYSNQNPLNGVEQESLFDFMSLSIMIDLYYKGFFIQSNHRRSNALAQGAEIGYQLFVENDHSLDVMFKTYIVGYQPKNLIENKNQDIPTLSGLKDREPAEAIAIRYSHFNEDTILSMDFANLTHISETNGWLIDFYFNELFQYKNWDIYFGGGITYYSKQVMNYYYGVKEHEVVIARPYYKPSNGYKASLEVYAQYPISKQWSFNTGLAQNYYSSSINNSPIIDKQHTTHLFFGVLYVF